MAKEPDAERVFVYLSHITKILAVLAVLVVILAICVRAPEKSGGGQNLYDDPGAKQTEDLASGAKPDISKTAAPEPKEIKTAESSSAPEKTEASAKKLLNGRYKQVYYNGDVYIGDFVDSIRSGQGTYTWSNGVVYTGEFARGEPTGNGVYVYPDGTTSNPPPPAETAPVAAPPGTTEPPPATAPPAPAETNPPPSDYVYAEPPKADFIQLMFEQAVDTPSGKIEPPPAGRSLETQYGATPLSGEIPEPYGYFKNFIFLGDSVTMGFDLFRGKITFGGEAVLRDAEVIAVGSYSVNNALRDISANSIHPLWGGKQTRPEDIIAAKEGKYVLICLGLNDLGLMPVEDYVQNYSLLIERIKEKSPGKTVVIMSVTPLVYAAQKTRLNNDAIAKANNALLVFAKENGIPFIDYGAAIRDSQNNLYDEFSSDAYCHLTISAYNRIVEYLLYHPLP